MTKTRTGSTLGHVHSWSHSVDFSGVIWGGGLPLLLAGTGCHARGAGDLLQLPGWLRQGAADYSPPGSHSSLQNEARVFFLGRRIPGCQAACIWVIGAFTGQPCWKSPRGTGLRLYFTRSMPTCRQWRPGGKLFWHDSLLPWKLCLRTKKSQLRAALHSLIALEDSSILGWDGPPAASGPSCPPELGTSMHFAAAG